MFEFVLGICYLASPGHSFEHLTHAISDVVFWIQYITKYVLENMERHGVNKKPRPCDWAKSLLLVHEMVDQKVYRCNAEKKEQFEHFLADVKLVFISY